MDERLSWIVTNLDAVLEVSLLAGTFLPLIAAAATVNWQRRPR